MNVNIIFHTCLDAFLEYLVSTITSNFIFMYLQYVECFMLKVFFTYITYVQTTRQLLVQVFDYNNCEQNYFFYNIYTFLKYIKNMFYWPLMKVVHAMHTLKWKTIKYEINTQTSNFYFLIIIWTGTQFVIWFDSFIIVFIIFRT